VFLEGAQRSSFGDRNSVIAPFVAALTVEDAPQGVSIRFRVDDPVLAVKGPQVNSDLVGVFPTVGQTIEDRGGRPLAVETDINGQRHEPPVAGPLADLKQGRHSIIWSVGQSGSIPGEMR
jgi:hypothetical protein